MDRNLKRHAVAPRVISRARKSPDKKKKDLRRPDCLLFVLNDLVLSLLSLQCLFRPALCPSFPSHKRLKFAETVYDTKFVGNFEG